MARKCLFCSSTDLSNEHIFPQWLLRELDITSEYVSMAHYSPSGESISKRQHRFNNLVCGQICKKCNNGWMSELEGKCKKHITNLMYLRDPKSELGWMAENQKDFTIWVLKTAILLNYSVNYRKLVPRKHFKLIYKGTVPRNINIDMGFTSSSEVVTWVQTPSIFAVKSPNAQFKSIQPFWSYMISLQFKSLLLKIFFYKSDMDAFYEDNGTFKFLYSSLICKTLIQFPYCFPLLLL